MIAAPSIRGVVELTADAEAALQREAEGCGGYPVDADVAALHSAAHNLIAECEAVLEAVGTSRRRIIQDRVPQRHV